MSEAGGDLRPASGLPVLCATDLDRTLIYSRSALGGDVRDAVCVEYLDGEPLSYMTSRSVELLTALTRQSLVVPTTTRTVEQFQRIDLPGAPWPFAITSNGGNILVDGHPDLLWRNAVAERARSSAALGDVVAEVTLRTDSSWVLKRRTADDLFCYLVVDVAAMPTGFVDDWSQWCAERGWGVSQQGRKIYAMPNAVCKSTAVAEVRRRGVGNATLTTDSIVVAAGDGALDADMLTAADQAIRPRHGELEVLDWSTRGLVITRTAGGSASEEILEWFGGRLRHL